MEKFFTKVIVNVFTDEQVQAAIQKLLGTLITEQILPLVPVAVSAAVKAAVDEVILKVPGVEGVVDAVHVADEARHALNNLIPDIDFGIPALDNLLDFWRPRG
jgi:hypothetical protein